MIIRKAEEKDLKDLLEIYNYEVLNGVATFDINPASEEERLAWLRNHNIKNHPLYVAEIDEKVVGYASLSEFRSKSAYDETVELSLYVAHDYRGRGIGDAQMKHILDIAKADESIHSVISVITGSNKASVRLHEKYCFEYCGTLKEAGSKFGRWLDVVYYQLFV